MSEEKAEKVMDITGAEAILLARGALGNPWLFERVLGDREGLPSYDEVVTEWLWVIDRSGEHFESDERAARYLRKFHPWYLDRFKEIDPETFTRARLNAINQDLQKTDSLEAARMVVSAIELPAAA
jgi:tRNA-dihydrouridine synthase